MQDFEHEVGIDTNEDMDKGKSDKPDIVLKKTADENPSDTPPVIEGYIGNDGYTFKIPRTNISTEKALIEFDNVLRYHRHKSPEGIQTIDGQTFPATSPEEEPWTISVWTNYGEHKIPYKGPSDWSTFVSDISQQREIGREQAEKAVAYVKVQTPFVRFGFEPGERVKDLTISATLADTQGFSGMVAHLTEGVDSKRISDFFEQLAPSKIQQ